MGKKKYHKKEDQQRPEQSPQPGPSGDTSNPPVQQPGPSQPKPTAEQLPKKDVQKTQQKKSKQYPHVGPSGDSFRSPTEQTSIEQQKISPSEKPHAIQQQGKGKGKGRDHQHKMDVSATSSQSHPLSPQREVQPRPGVQQIELPPSFQQGSPQHPEQQSQGKKWQRQKQQQQRGKQLQPQEALLPSLQQIQIQPSQQQQPSAWRQPRPEIQQQLGSPQHQFPHPQQFRPPHPQKFRPPHPQQFRPPQAQHGQAFQTSPPGFQQMQMPQPRKQQQQLQPQEAPLPSLQQTQIQPSQQVQRSTWGQPRPEIQQQLGLPGFSQQFVPPQPQYGQAPQTFSPGFQQMQTQPREQQSPQEQSKMLKRQKYQQQKGKQVEEPPYQQGQLPPSVQSTSCIQQSPIVTHVEEVRKDIEKGTIQKKELQPEKMPSEKSESPLELIVPQRKQLQSAGTAGKRIMIETNHLPLIIRNLKTVIHYDASLTPELPKRLLRPAMEAFRVKYYPNRYPAFDGRKNLYSSPALPFGTEISGDVTVLEDNREKVFHIKVKYAAELSLSALNDYFGATGRGQRHMVTPQQAIQCLDVVLRSAPSLNLIPVGRSYFTKPRDQIIDLGEGMEMYYGFYQSAILGWKPFLNVDVSHKAFPKSLCVVDLIAEVCNVDISARLMDRHFQTINKFLRTLKVQYEIPNNPASRRVMRCNELDRPANEARFTTDNGQVMTVDQYFRLSKNYTLRYPHLPCLWVGSRNRETKMLYPPELCTVLEGQVTNLTMTPNQTSGMIRVAATSTVERKNKIMKTIRGARFNQDPTVREFEISVNENFSQVPARILDSPDLQYSDGIVKPDRGVWRGKKFCNGKTLENWSIICIDDRTRQQAIQEFASELINTGISMGMRISTPRNMRSVRLSFRREKQELEEIFNKLKPTELVLVIIPNDNKEIYTSVKQAAELSIGTLTQCVRARNVFRPKISTVSNILLKINVKLNGINHVLRVRPRCLTRPCMIMGADVTHPSPESRGTVPSVAAVTASHDPSAFHYNICWRLQPPAHEIIQDLENIVHHHLMFFYRKNKQMKPERIIFFRDGVSEGQFETVVNAEVNTIRSACLKVQRDGSYKPKVTFLVVQKRHHTRFFPTNPRDSQDKNFNVPAGTVVDTEITHPTAIDFYLVSHASIQGVARPTKYRMLWDENDMDEDELEQLTYHLCHLFTRCTRSVSYPAPTYYAHLAAARAKVYCERRRLNMDDLAREQAQLIVRDEVIRDMPMFFV